MIARGHRVARELSVSVFYKGDAIATQRLDLVVDEKRVLEVKSTSELHKAAIRQLFNYLRATRLEVGLLLHFGPEPKFFGVVYSNRSNNSAERRQPA